MVAYEDKSQVTVLVLMVNQELDYTKYGKTCGVGVKILKLQIIIIMVDEVSLSARNGKCMKSLQLGHITQDMNLN